MSGRPEDAQPIEPLASETEPATSGVDQGSGVSRRDVMRTLALVPLAGILEWSGADVARAARFVATLEEEGSQQFAPKFFTPDEYRTVRVLVDYVIPRDARSGSATDARVPEFMDFMYSDPEQNTSAQTKAAVKNGLAWLDAESTKRFSKTFVGASDAERRQILDDIAWPAKARPEMSAGVTFFNRFRDMTAGGFFSSAIGWKDLPYIGNVAVAEWKGCPEAALRKLDVTYDLMNTRVPVQNGSR